MSEKFKTGDVVRLKSGGSTMTVANYVEILGDKVIVCMWHEKSKSMTANYYEAMLDKVDTTA